MKYWRFVASSIRAGKEFSVPVLNKPLLATIIITLTSLPVYLLFSLSQVRVPVIYIILLLILPLSILAIRYESIFYSLVGDNNRTLELGERYRVITSGLIHADYLHLGFNALSLILIGVPLEESLYIKVGWLAGPVILGAFLVGVYLGGILTLKTKFGRLNPLHLGSSSGVLALLTLFVLLNPSANIYVFGVIGFNSITFLGIFTLLTIISLYKFIPIFDMFLSFSRKRINHAGHLGGVVAGAILFGFISLVIK